MPSIGRIWIGLVAVGVIVVAVFAGWLIASKSSGSDSSGRNLLLKFSVDSKETERGSGDTGNAGLSKGDTYVSNGVLRDETGADAGTYHVACVITDEEDDKGSAWSLCSTAAVIDGHGTLLAYGATELLQVETSGNGFGVAPPTSEFALQGGTGEYEGAVGQVTSTRDASKRDLTFRVTLMKP